jgi:hypothetical protein
MSEKLTPDAKEAIALAFQGLGGVKRLIKWANASASHLMIFYTQMYVKLLPYQLTAKVDHTVTDDNAIREKMTTALVNIIKARREGRGSTVTVDGVSLIEDCSSIDAALDAAIPERIAAAAGNIHTMAALLDDTDVEYHGPRPATKFVDIDVHEYTRSTNPNASAPKPAPPRAADVTSHRTKFHTALLRMDERRW